MLSKDPRHKEIYTVISHVYVFLISNNKQNQPIVRDKDIVLYRRLTGKDKEMSQDDGLLCCLDSDVGCLVVYFFF